MQNHYCEIQLYDNGLLVFNLSRDDDNNLGFTALLRVIWSYAAEGRCERAAFCNENTIYSQEFHMPQGSSC